jgi:hypothetical protein
MRADHNVRFTREETLAGLALTWRREARNQNDAYFNIVKFVEGILSGKTKQPFKINFLETAEGETPAFVTFNPRTLHIDRSIWDLADRGEPEARFIVAHEIGHLILHDHFAKAFSNDPGDRIQFAVREYSAEWQANTFAFYFLLPDLIVAAYRSISELSTSCSVQESVARERVAMSPRLNLLYSASESGVCPDCGNFTTRGECKSSVCRRSALVSDEVQTASA